MKRIKRILAALLAVLTIITSIPLSAIAAPASDIPDKMLNNDFLDALAYTGYKVQAQKNDGTIFKKYAWQDCSAYLSGITYDNNYTLSGTETVSDSSTITGKAPNIARFKEAGLCCASYVSYVLFNYLPNIKGYDMSGFEKPSNLRSASSYHDAAEKWVSAKVSHRITFTQSSDGKTFKPDEEIPIGSLVVFKSGGTYSHVALYAGEYNGKHFVTHVGNSRGPEIHTIEEMEKGDGMELVANIYTIIEEYGSIEVYKKDTNGKALSGAIFMATNDSTGQQFQIGPTDSTGYAKTNDITQLLPYGSYTVKETVFPKNYRAYGQTEWKVTLNAKNNGVATINAVNEEVEGYLKIVKTSDDGVVAGVRFKVGNDEVFKYVTTGADGTITTTLKPGKWTVTEQTEDRYEPQESKTVTVVSGETSTVTFNNKHRRGDIKVIKTTEDGFVEGMRFHLEGTSKYGIKVDQYAETNGSGIAMFTGIPIGNYTLSEVNCPIQYIVPPSQKVPVEWKKVTTAEFENELKRGDLKIVKTVEDGFLSGKRFHLTGTSTSGEKIDMYATTNAQGIALFEDIPIGNNFKVSEVDVPIQYIPPESQTAAIEWNKVTTLKFDNPLKRGNIEVIKTSEDNYVKGIKFHLTGTSTSGTTVNEYAYTNSKGVASFNDILIGTYKISEEDVFEWYEIPEDQTVTVKWKDTATVEFHNKLKRGDLVVIKSSEDNFVEGLRFHLSGTSLSGIPVDEYATTTKAGKATFKDILIGKNYVLEEVDTPIKYVVPDSQIAPIEWKKVTNTNVENILKKFRVQLTKSDSEKGLPQGDATLAGAVYGIYKGGKLIDTYTTDINGQFTTKYYICDNDWTLKEISPSEGYLLDHTVHKIASEPNLYTFELNTTSNASAEDVIKGSVALIKHTDDGSTQVETPEAGAEFQIYLKSAGSYAKAKATERDILVCDDNGFAQSKKLPYGVYTIHQTKGWDGREKIADFDVFIAKDEYVYHFILNNRNFESYIKVVKVDSETGKAIPYAGAAFQIYAPDGTLITQTFTYPTPTTIDTFYTNSEGYLVTPEKLPFGSGYKLVERQAPYGYVLDSTPIVFDVRQEDSTKEDNLTIITIKRPNVPQKGIIEVTKTGEVFASVTNSDNTYTPVFAEQGLPNAVFEIYAYENIYTPDGTLRYKKGQLVDTITTGKDSIAKSKELYLGKYTVIEKTAPNTFYNSDLKYNVALTYAGQDVKVTSTALSVYNERQRVSVSLDKIMEQDNTFSIGMNGEILSVQFGLYANEVITAADGTSIPKDGLIATAFCNENGEITFPCDLPIGFNWYVKEIATDEHYILSNTKYAFATEYKGQDTAAYEIKVNNGKSINNELIYGAVKGLKIDRETKGTIAGAVFGLFKPNELDFTEETAILTAVSDKNGVFVFENIPYGDWIICELQPAENYLHNDDIHHIQINGDGQILNIQVVNDRIPEIFTTATIEGEKEIGATEVFTLTDVVEYKHLIPGKTYVLTGILMNKNTGEALRINGKTIRSKVEFKPENPSGEIAVEFTFDSKYIKEDTDIVVFETLYRDGVELTAHKDINDEGQTVLLKVPTVGTTATIDGEKEIGATEIFTLTDIVKYDNLVIGKEYVLTGVLMNRNTGEPLVINGENICSEVVFVPESTSGEMTVEFTFDSKFIKEDTDVVVFETLYRNDVEIASHADINDAEQTVLLKVPTIGTTATIDGEKEIGATEVFTLTDIVKYDNLVAGKEYVIKGVLMNKTTGEPLVINGENIRSEIVFVPESTSGELTVEFTFDSKYIKEDTEIVVFETLYRNDVEIASHADIDDLGQTVLLKVPTVGTTATIDGEKVIGATEVFTLADIVEYKNLVIGKEYVIKGVLMNKTTGEPLVIDGENICSEVVFVAEKINGTILVEFTFDSKYIKEDTDIVVFETLYRSDVEIASHTDINDEEQTISLKVPTIGTTATIEGEKEIGATEVFTLTDIVKYDNLVIGKEYVLKGILMNKTTGKPLVIDGENIYSEVVFVPEATSGEVAVEFVFDSKYIKEDTNIVVYEVLYRNDVEIASHTDINDEGQTTLLKAPKIGTTATIDGEKVIGATEVFTLTDVVKYENLVIGKEYVVKGILMNKTTGKPLVINGENICSEVVFVPESANGEVTVEFTFDSKLIKEDTDVVVFETLYRNDVEIASHTDIDDAAQTVSLKVPTIGTSATVDGEKEITATEVFTLTDTVKYDNLVIGKEYVIKGVLMDKTTHKPLIINGKEVCSEIAFVPESASGEIAVEFVFDSKNIKADTAIVVFETLYRDGVEIASHADIKDKDQTVNVKVPAISTSAEINGKKNAVANGEITIKDTVKYSNLTPGKEYTIKGVLMDKSTGKPFIFNGKTVTSEITFVPKTRNGEVAVLFTFDASGIKETTKLVVFETLYRGDDEIAAHEDIKDKAQTVTIKAAPDDTPKTGDDSNRRTIATVMGTSAFLLSTLLYFLLKKKKRNDKEEA